MLRRSFLQSLPFMGFLFEAKTPSNKETMAFFGDEKYIIVDGEVVCKMDKYCKKHFLNGELHRENGPAIEYASGGEEWFLNGKKHRVDGPAAVDSFGNKYWYFDNKLHRVDGPAIEGANGTKAWWQHGNLHREDGPAIESLYEYKEWYLNGVPQYAKIAKHNQSRRTNRQ